MNHQNSSLLKVNILGSYISVYDCPETVTQMIAKVNDPQTSSNHYICVANVHTVIEGTKNLQYQNITNQAWLATADGLPLVWASNLLVERNHGVKIHGRASGPDILHQLLNNPSAQSIRHFFYGSTPSVLAQLEKQLTRNYRHIKIAGMLAPPQRSVADSSTRLSEEELAECQLINQTKPDIIWVGLGAPKQEIFMFRARPHLTAKLQIGVGAAFDFLAGNKKRAPVLLQKMGLEWAYRLSQEPRRLAGRYLSTNPRFVRLVLQEFLGK